VLRRRPNLVFAWMILLLDWRTGEHK